MNLISELQHFNSFKKLFPLLSIRKKIVFGYTLSLDIATLGTSSGLFVGDRYFQTARDETILVNQEGLLLSNLQGGVLEILIHQ